MYSEVPSLRGFVRMVLGNRFETLGFRAKRFFCSKTQRLGATLP